jgi:peptidoglycan/LPS O-acetylase OafA/YrhL
LKKNIFSRTITSLVCYLNNLSKEDSFLSTASLTGLKGNLAILIFIIHGSIFTILPIKGTFLENFVGFFQYAVFGFFMISGFTVWLSLYHKNITLIKFTLKKFIRIFPLYIFYSLLGLLIFFLAKHKFVEFRTQYYIDIFSANN